MKAKRIPAGLVRKILVRDVGLAEDEAWTESPRRRGLVAAGDSYAEVVKLAEDGIPFALGHEATLENFVPAGEHVAA
jgi:predicted RNase H-like HicB family nuclease